MFNRILAALGVAALAASALAVATPAFAQDEEATSVTVSYAGLDFSRPADAARFERRLRNAVREVCGDVPRDLNLKPRVQACRSRATANAKADLAVALNGRSGTAQVALRTN